MAGSVRMFAPGYDDPQWVPTHLVASRVASGWYEAEPPSDAELRAAYGAPVLSGRMVTLGDSLTERWGQWNGIGGKVGTRIWDEWPMYAAMLTDQKINLVRNAGIGGETTAQMLARFDTDVTPVNPGVVTLLAGTNEMNAPERAGWQTNMLALIAKVRSIGALPVLVTLPPAGTNVTEPVIRNAWLRKIATEQRLPVLDFYTLATDPLTAQMAAAMGDSDDIHPGNAGKFLWGQHAANVLGPLLPPGGPRAAGANNDGVNKVLNPLMQGTPINGRAPDWSGSALPAGASFTVQDNAAWLGGKVQRITNDGVAEAGMMQVRALTDTGIAVGDRIAYSGRMTVSGDAIGYARLLFVGPSSYVDACRVSVPITRGRFYIETTVPTGTTSTRLQFSAGAPYPGNSTPPSGNGYIEFGEVVLDNLTQLGVA